MRVALLVVLSAVAHAANAAYVPAPVPSEVCHWISGRGFVCVPLPPIDRR